MFVNLCKYLFILKIAFNDCPDKVFWALENEPPEENTMPK